MKQGRDPLTEPWRRSAIQSVGRLIIGFVGRAAGLVLARIAWLALPSLLAGLSSGCHSERVSAPQIVVRFSAPDLGRRSDAGAAPGEPRGPATGQDAAVTPLAPPAGPATGEPAAEVECRSDGDCAVLQSDCCSCTAGGQARVLPRARLAETRRALEVRCERLGMMCPQVISTHPSCRQRAACRQHRCRLVD